MRAAVVLITLGALAFGGTKKMTVEDSLGIHRVAGPRFSPDGNWIVYTETDWDKKNDKQVTHLWISKTTGNPSPGKLNNGEKGEAAPQRLPDGPNTAFLEDTRTTASTARTR